MWRKQDEPKTPSQDVKVSTPNEVAAAAPAVTPAPVVSAPTPSLSPRQASAPAGHLTSSLVLKGEITGREDLFIDGEVQGKIRLEDGRVTIGPNGRVIADVQAREIVVRGKVKGNLHGRDRVQVGPTGNATGDIMARLISIEEGAEVHGKVEIVRSDEPRSSRASLASTDDEVGVSVGAHGKDSGNGL